MLEASYSYSARNSRGMESRKKVHENRRIGKRINNIFFGWSWALDAYLPSPLVRDRRRWQVSIQSGVRPTPRFWGWRILAQNLQKKGCVITKRLSKGYFGWWPDILYAPPGVDSGSTWKFQPMSDFISSRWALSKLSIQLVMPHGLHNK